MRRDRPRGRTRGRGSGGRRPGGRLRARRARDPRDHRCARRYAHSGRDELRGGGDDTGDLCHRDLCARHSGEAASGRVRADPRRRRRGRSGGDPVREAARRDCHRDGRVGGETGFPATGRRRSCPRLARSRLCRRGARDCPRRRRCRAEFAERRGDGAEPRRAETVRALSRTRQARLLPEPPHPSAAAAAEYFLFRDRCGSAAGAAARSRARVAERDRDGPGRGSNPAAGASQLSVRRHWRRLPPDAGLGTYRQAGRGSRAGAGDNAAIRLRSRRRSRCAATGPTSSPAAFPGSASRPRAGWLRMAPARSRCSAGAAAIRREPASASRNCARSAPTSASMRPMSPMRPRCRRRSTTSAGIGRRCAA